MKTYDVAVTGGGPIGCFAAQQLAVKGRQVAVFEEHDTIGQPIHCAGLVTQRVFNIAQIPPNGIIQNTVYGAHIHSPSGMILSIGGDTVHALVIDRQRFDQTIADKARQAGAEINEAHKVIGAKQKENQIILTIQQKNKTSTVSSPILIGADGPRSFIRKTFRFPPPAELLYGIGAELADTTIDPKFVHILVGHTVAPGFFAWIIPTNAHGTTARIGLCIKKQSPHPPPYYLNALLRNDLLQGTSVLQKFGGTIPLGPLNRTAADHVMLVGDAAAQVKPTSGGGIYPGLVCATDCATIADQALHHQRYDAESLHSYYVRWTKEIGRELSLGMRFRKVFTRCTDAQLTKYLKKLNTEKTRGVINTYGDIDYPSRLALPLLRASPSLLSLVPSLLKPGK